MRSLVMVLALTLGGCGEVSRSSIPEAFAADVGEFYSYTGSSTPIVIQYGTLDDEYRGYCTINHEYRGFKREVARTIIIDRTKQPDTPWRRKALVWHEMGHCVYRLSHVDDPEALMYPEDRSDLEPGALEAYWQASLYTRTSEALGDDHGL